MENQGFGWGARNKLKNSIGYQTKKLWQEKPRYERALKKVGGAQERLSSPVQAARKIYDKAKSASEVSDKLTSLFELLSYANSEALPDIGLSRAQVRLWIKKTYLEALGKARQGDRNEFLQLRAFFGERKEYHKLDPINGRPKDWSELVVRYLDNPDLSDFREGRVWYSHELPSTGELRLMAAEAIRTKSLLQCQETLAYCNHDDDYRQEVGDRLLAELAKLVDRLQLEARAKEVTA